MDIRSVFRSLSLAVARELNARQHRRRNIYRRHFAAQGLEARLLLTAVTDNYFANANDVTVIPAAQGVLANDSGTNLTAVLVSQPAFGSVTLNSDGSLTYTNTSTSDSDGFSYEDFDGSNYSDPATVYLTLSDNGAAPYQSFTPAQISVVHDHGFDWSAPGVLSEMTDPNGIPLTAVLVSNPAHGTATLSSDGELVYTPDHQYVGDDSLTFEASNGNQSSAPVSVDFDVTDAAPVAQLDNYGLLNTQTLNVSAASGVLANDTDADGDSLTASLVSQPSHGSLTFNSDGSFAYTPTPGWLGDDSFEYQASDGIETSGVGTVTLHTEYSVLSAVDESKLPVDTVHVSRPILNDPFANAITSPLPAGGSGGTSISAAPADGAPATAHNLSLVYDSVLAQPDAVIEVGIGLSTADPATETVTASLTFNGVAQPDQYFTMSSLDGSDSNVLLSQQVDTSALASGRYPWSMTVTSPDMAAPATVSGYVNVVNDSASPFGKGWDMPGLYRLFQNSVDGVPTGMLLSTGDGGAWYYTQNDDGSYTSPNGPLAFSTLTMAGAGGWQLVTHQGVTFNFDGGGYLSSRMERTGETTTYNWSGDELTSIVDQFGRVIPLDYSGGLLSSIQDFAASTWAVAHSGTNLTSITEPDPGSGSPGSGSPVWQYAYTGNYMSSETDPNLNQASFTLDGFHRLSGTSLPGGATTADTSEQDFGYGSTDSNNPAGLTLATSVAPTSTNADGNQSSYQTDQFGNVVYEVDPYGNATSVQRDLNGLPTQITLPPPTAGAAAPVTNISYTTTGDETSATGAQPTYGTFIYTTDSFGQWATFTDITGHQWVRSFDTRGDILSEQDPGGALISWTYDTYGHPLTMSLPAPNNASGTVTTQLFYDDYERLHEILWPDGSTQFFGYNDDDYQTSFQDENAHTTVTTLDALNRATLVTDALSHSVATTYDKDSNVLTTTNQLGQVTTNLYNSRNELVQQTLPDPDGAGPLTAPVLSFTYSATGKELTETDWLNRTTTRVYDKLDRLVSVTSPDPDGAGPLTSPVTTFGYDNLSRQTSQTNALSGTTITAYANTDINQVTSVELPAPSGSGSGPMTSYFYDADGRRNETENALGQFTTTTFTVNGQTASVEDNLHNTTTSLYGNGGELLSTTDPLNHTESGHYDSRYRLVQTTDANSGVTQITLDPAGNRLKLIDPDNNETDWTYSATNLPLTETNVEGTTTTTYDAASQTTSIEDADGRVRDFLHDSLGRLTAENWMQGGTIVASMNYAYDAANELVSASDANSAYAFAYNGDGQVTSVDNAGTPSVPDVVLTSTANAMGERTSLAATINGTADFLNNYSYDADQRLTMVQQQDVNGGDVVSPKEVDYGYNALGQFTSAADFNFVGVGPRMDVLTGAYSYDNGARLTGIAYTSNGGATTIDALGWGLDAASNVTSFTSTDGEADYGYDATNQLTSANYTTSLGGHQPANETFSFDPNGNRNSTGYSTGGDNLLTSDGTFNYQHDADGNTTVRTRISTNYATDYETTYTWDYRNRLTDVEYFDNNAVLTKHAHFVYGVFDHLIATEVDSTGSGQYDTVQRYVLDVSPEIPSAGVPGTALAQPVLQFDGNGGLTTRFLVGLAPTGGKTVAAQESVPSSSQGGPVIWAADDNLGTPRDLVDNSGTLANHRVFSAFGQDVYESDPSLSYWVGFGGGHTDSLTSLVNDYHRWYDAADGKWLSNDPKKFSAGDADLSRYVDNNSIRTFDQTGLQDPDSPDTGGYIPYDPTQPYTGLLALRGAQISAPPPAGVEPPPAAVVPPAPPLVAPYWKTSPLFNAIVPPAERNAVEFPIIPSPVPMGVIPTPWEQTQQVWAEIMAELQFQLEMQQLFQKYYEIEVEQNFELWQQTGQGNIS